MKDIFKYIVLIATMLITGISYADTYTEYFAQDAYDNYEHHCQNNRTATTPSRPCGQTAYMVARHMVNQNFTVNKYELENIHNRLLAWTAYANDPYARVDQLEWLADGNQYYDGDPGVSAGYYSGTSRNIIKSIIQNTLVDQKPLLIPVEYNFINNAMGHYIIVVGLNYNETLNGVNSTIFYIDVFDSDANLKEVNYTIMLDSCKRNSETDNLYNVMWFN